MAASSGKERAVQLIPYLNFNGDCAAAFRFYEQCLGGRIAFMQTHGESPIAGEVPADWQKLVLHARLDLDGGVLMGSDAPPGQYAPAQGMYVSVHPAGRAEAQRVFEALADGGRVVMPFQETFWSPGFGMAVDRFGTQWMVNAAS